MPFEDVSFDGALLSAVLTCIPAADDRSLLEGGPTRKHFSLEELRALFSGFTEEKATEFAVTTMRGNPARAIPLWLVRL